MLHTYQIQTASKIILHLTNLLGCKEPTCFWSMWAFSCSDYYKLWESSTLKGVVTWEKLVKKRIIANQNSNLWELLCEKLDGINAFALAYSKIRLSP